MACQKLKVPLLHAAEATGPATLPALNLAAVLHCLADAPRLPSFAWQAVCQTLFSSSTGDQSGSFTSASTPATQPSTAGSESSLPGNSNPGDVNTAVLLLALKHGSMASHGLGSFLDSLTTTQGSFTQLPLPCQQVLLVSLPELLQSISTQRSTALLAMLSMLCSSKGYSNSNWLQTPKSRCEAMWLGLARCLHSMQQAQQQAVSWPAAVTAAAHAAVLKLLPQLPPPPVLLPGQQLPQPSQELHSALLSNEFGLPEDEGAEAAGDQGLDIWGAALTCLQLMPSSKVSQHGIVSLVLRAPGDTYRLQVVQLPCCLPCSWVA